MDNGNSRRNMKKKTKRNLSPEAQFTVDINQCTKTKSLTTAISLYNTALDQSIHLSHHHFNSLLYIAADSLTDPNAIEFGFRVFQHMLSSNLKPNEATITAVARLAAAKEDGEYAFELARSLATKYGGLAKLRTFGPALFCFCRNGMADKAFEVETHMVSVGLSLEEPELAALLKVSVDKGREEKVYEYFHKLRRTVEGVSELTAEIIESWFKSEAAAGVGLVNWDVGEVKEAILGNGGGWHGIGWLGKGEWMLQRSNIASDGKCCICREQLVCVDIDRVVTERFAHSVASLAMEREVHSNFEEFQDWLNSHADYGAIIDGANVGLYQQNFAEGGFSLSQLDSVVKALYNRSKKWPLVVLHNKRVRTLLENPSSRKLLDEWINQGILYGAPHGSNDDWYWLYAAVKLKCLLVTNDEMRDHIFELLGSSFFIRWKARHQAKYTFVKGNLELLMPPSYSVVIQESSKGSWHVPLKGKTEDDLQSSWLCITRPNSLNDPHDMPSNVETSLDSQLACGNLLLKSCKFSLIDEKDSNGGPVSSPNSENIPTSVTGKRKARSPSRPDSFTHEDSTCESLLLQ